MINVWKILAISRVWLSSFWAPKIVSKKFPVTLTIEKPYFCLNILFFKYTSSNLPNWEPTCVQHVVLRKTFFLILCVINVCWNMLNMQEGFCTKVALKKRTATQKWEAKYVKTDFWVRFQVKTLCRIYILMWVNDMTGLFLCSNALFSFRINSSKHDMCHLFR